MRIAEHCTGKWEMVNEEEKQALMDVERALIRIRAIAVEARLAGTPERLDNVSRQIELLADAAHNIPRVVANGGDAADPLANSDNLRVYAGECRKSLLANRG